MSDDAEQTVRDADEANGEPGTLGPDGAPDPSGPPLARHPEDGQEPSDPDVQAERPPSEDGDSN